MLSPNVTYMPRKLEHVVHDTFNDVPRVLAGGDPVPTRAHVSRPAKVVELHAARIRRGERAAA